MKVREACPACNAIEQEPCFVANGYDIKRCLGCGTLYVQNLPPQEKLAEIYTSDAYYELTTDAKSRIAHENQRRMTLIRRFKPAGDFLDIGCAQGLLLDLAKQAGYITHGVEPTYKNAEMARAKGHTVSNGWLSDFAGRVGKQRFDVITCLDVIEHINDPKPFLVLASSLLTEGGLMVISTPNYSGVVAKLLGKDDPFMTPPEHVTFFTSKGLNCLVVNCGLSFKLSRSFGTLIPAEMDRSIERFVPKPMRFLAPFIRPCVQFVFWSMNHMNVGLEQEIYLNKTI